MYALKGDNAHIWFTLFYQSQMHGICKISFKHDSIKHTVASYLILRWAIDFHWLDDDVCMCYFGFHQRWTKRSV